MRPRRPASSPFQRTKGPIIIRITTGVISGTKVASKYGGPTEILPMLSASRNSGYSVPSSTAKQATASSTLLPSSEDSRDSSAKLPPPESLGARHANRLSEMPMTSTSSARMYRPRVGSVAKACTEVITPERTRKVPSSDSEKAPIASSTVQLRKAPRFSVTASEWISAVPSSHGMKEAFSTGSQNHQPPQPSS